MNNIDYISIKDASIKWNMDESKIGKLIRSGKISGVTKLGCHWLIPKKDIMVVESFKQDLI